MNSQEVYIRINKDPRVLSAEVLGYTLFRSIGIPVPDIISYQANPVHIGYPTMIMNAAKGVELVSAELSPEQRDTIYENMGRMLHTLHQTKLTGYGPVQDAGGHLVGIHSSWNEFWQSGTERFNENLEYIHNQGLITHDERELLTSLYNELGLSYSQPASALHCDVHGAHIFVTGDTITGIIDLEKISAGDPRYDIATSLVFQDPRQREYFLRGYGPAASDPIVMKYVAIIAAQKIARRSRRGNNQSAQKALRILRETVQIIADRQSELINSD